MNLIERTGAIVVIALIGLFIVGTLLVPNHATSATTSSLAQSFGGPTATPGPEPSLQSPANEAILPQPVAPNKWTFNWQGPRCGHTIHLDGPGNRDYVFTGVMGQGHAIVPFTYSYTQTQALPADALAPWNWHVEYDCSTYQGQSITRTFSVVPANFVFLPYTTQ